MDYVEPSQSLRFFLWCAVTHSEIISLLSSPDNDCPTLIICPVAGSPRPSTPHRQWQTWHGQQQYSMSATPNT